VVVDKGLHVCGAKIFFEGEFTLVARAQITARGTVDERPRRQRQCDGVLSAPVYAAAGVRNTGTLGGGRC